MEIRFQAHGPAAWKAAAILVPVFEGEDPARKHKWLDEACPWLCIAPALGDFHGKDGELGVFYGHPDLALPRVMLVGLGKEEELDLDRIRNAIGSGMPKARDLALESVILPEPALAEIAGGRQRLVEEGVYAALLGLYRFTKLKKDDDLKDPAWLAVGFEGEIPDGMTEAARRGELAAEAVCRCRDLCNMPANLLNTEALADKADEMAKEAGFTCKRLDPDALLEEGLGCILAVGQGSAQKARLLVLEHAPAGHNEEKPLILIGKGITFDSGGICLKPAANMFQMKGDMGGAAAVLCAVWAAARENIPRRVIGILACAENMPDARAMRPGDVVIAGNGQSVEIINTDAEGRLCLCDAITYAQKYWNPQAIVDIATLTGACAVALGTSLGGLFCDDDSLAAKISASGKLGGENFWRLPLYSPYLKELTGGIADLRNSGPREGGAITAALFLRNFVRKGELWAHLDIAGVDWNAKARPLCPEGATGFGCRALIELCRGGVA